MTPSLLQPGFRGPSRRRWLQSIAALGAGSAALAPWQAALAQVAQPSNLYAGAQLLLAQILQSQAAGVRVDAQGVSINRYGGSWSSSTDPSFVRFADPMNGVLPGNNSKCSSLLSRLLQTLHGWSWNQSAYAFVDPVTGLLTQKPSPEAYQYGALIRQGLGFAELTYANQVQPGDVLAWWLNGSTESDHVMLVHEVRWNTLRAYPTGLPNSNAALAGTQFVEVRVIDCSSDTHTQDTRLVSVNGQLTHIAGIGEGTIGLLLDATGRILGRTWSLPEADFATRPNTWVKSLNSRLKLQPTWGFAVGRVVMPG
jgi:hypothetical protein